MIESIYYLLILFPFVRWFGYGMSSDVQPFYLIAAVGIIISAGLKRPLRINRDMKLLYIEAVIGLLVGIIFTVINSGLTLDGVPRYIVTYSGLILNTLAAYLTIEKNKGLNEKAVKSAIIVYLLVGLVQKTLSSNFMYGWVSNPRTSETRGVISLASEPSFYGYMCIFFMVLSLEFSSKKTLFMILLLFQIFALANSSVTMLYIALFAAICVIILIVRLDMKRVAFICAVGIVCAYGVYKWLSIHRPDSRSMYFINMLMNADSYSNLTEQLSRDGSATLRFSGIMFCLEGFIRSFGMPHGFSAGKMSSGYGAMLYTMGWMGAVLIIRLFKIMKKGFKGTYVRALPYFLTIIMFSSIQVSYPLFGYMLALCSYKTFRPVR